MPSMASKKLTQQTVRLSEEMMRAVGHHLVDTGESFQSFVLRLITKELQTAGIEQQMPDTSHPAHHRPISEEELRAILREFETRITAAIEGDTAGKKQA